MKDLIIKTIIAAWEIRDEKTLQEFASGHHFKGDEQMREIVELVEKFNVNRSWEELRQGLLHFSHSRDIVAGAYETVGVDEFIRRAREATVRESFSLSFEIHSLGTLRYDKMLWASNELIVYKLSGEQGQEYMMKISQGESKDLSREKQRVADYGQYGLNHVGSFEGDVRYSIGEFIAGERGDEFIERWKRSGGNQADPKVKKLHELAKKMMDGFFYLEGLHLQNMVWSDATQGWVIIDSGPVQKIEDREEVRKKIALSFGNGWFRPPSISAELFSTCMARLDGIVRYISIRGLRN